MFSHNHQKNHAQQLLGLMLAVALLTSFLAASGFSGTRSPSSKIAQRNSAPNQLNHLDTPALKANGKIAFVSNRDGNDEIYVMNPDGSNQIRLTSNLSRDSGPVWSPNGLKLAFSSNRDGNYEIYVMNADGSNQTRLTNNPAADGAHVWSPDGLKIAFSSNRDANDQIYVMAADGSNQTRLTNNSSSDQDPLWSPDGRKISFERHSDLYVMDADGNNQMRVSHLVPGYLPAWSTDGLKFAINGDNGLFVLNTDGANFTRLTSNPDPNGKDYFPTWSKDNQTIAFTRESDCVFDFSNFEIICDAQIWLVNADGSNARALTSATTNYDYEPVWSPDNTKISFLHFGNDPGFHASIVVMNADGSGITNISNRPGSDDYSSSWQALPVPSVIDQAQVFVHQHYLDFLNRGPDPAGLAFWTQEIVSCGVDAGCVEAKRVNVSAAFFLSIEFQETGYLVYRMHKAAYGNLPGTPVPVRLNEFLPDTQQIGQGVVVGAGNWQAKLDSNKQTFATDFVSRSRFTSAYATTMTPAQFVDALFANAGVTPSASERAAAINEFGSASTTDDTAARARALRLVAENSVLAQQEFNKAFVLMQYFGYLRRNPNDAPELGLNFDGYNFWLNKLNQFNGNFVDAEMVKAFILSGEYRQRFGL
ncbi:MAG: DPP IV N-terminal domain-containing protein [Acidobacteriota bacterium]